MTCFNFFRLLLTLKIFVCVQLVLFTVTRTTYSAENDVASTLMGNKTVLYEENAKHSSENLSLVEESAISSVNDEANITNEIDIINIQPDVSEASSSDIKIAQYSTDDNKDIHRISLETPIQEGIYSLKIDYQVLIDENAFFIANYSEDEQ